MPAKYEPFDWYETPLYYDMVFDADTRIEGDFLERVYEQYAPGQRRRVLEPACGSGRLVAELAARGYRVTGFDLSPGALAFARQRLRPAGLRARLCQARLESFVMPGQFELAHCLVSSFRYLLTEEHARAHLQCVADALVPGGVYVLGFHLTEYGGRSTSRERWDVERQGVRVVCSIQGEAPVRQRRRQAMRARLVVRAEGRVRRYETRWVFRTYDVRQFRALLAKVPALEHVDTYDFDYDLERPTVLGAERLDQVVLLRKRG